MSSFKELCTLYCEATKLFQIILIFLSTEVLSGLVWSSFYCRQNLALLQIHDPPKSFTECHSCSTGTLHSNCSEFGCLQNLCELR